MYLFSFFFFFNDTATTEIYTLSLHDALPICEPALVQDLEQHVEDIRVGLLDLVEQHDGVRPAAHRLRQLPAFLVADVDRKSTRLNSSHGYISYAVFCLKKKKICQARPHGPR